MWPKSTQRDSWYGRTSEGVHRRTLTIASSPTRSALASNGSPPSKNPGYRGIAFGTNAEAQLSRENQLAGDRFPRAPSSIAAAALPLALAGDEKTIAKAAFSPLR